jgi:hypothetical protein
MKFETESHFSNRDFIFLDPILHMLIDRVISMTKFGYFHKEYSRYSVFYSNRPVSLHKEFLCALSIVWMKNRNDVLETAPSSSVGPC